MREVEVKAHVDDWEALKERIDSLYGKPDDVNKSDLYFAMPGEIHQALRIRNNKGVLELTTKRLSSDSLTEDNIEYEVMTDISQEQTAISFFECLGYEKYFRKIKSGWEWMVDSIHVELMEVSGYSYRKKGGERNVGWFIELEILLPPTLKVDLREKQKSLYDLLSRLGISEDKIETRSYRSMILEN